MITIAIRSLGGIDRADLQISPICLVSGVNAVGKTSICRGVAAALSGRVVPIDGMKKGESGALVRTGGAEGTVKITTAAGAASVRWPDPSLETTGNPPQASAFAVGLDSIVALDEKGRAKALAPYLPGAVPTREDLTAALKDAEIADDTINRVWKKITDDGWDATHTFARDSGIKLKQSWEDITGDNYGSDKARKWSPKGWTEDLLGASLDKLEQDAATAKVALEQTIAGAAVDAATIERLRTEATPLENLQTKSLELQTTIDDLVKEVEGRQAARQALPPATNDAGTPCPHCNESIAVRQTGPGQWLVTKAEKKLPPAELKKRRDAIAAADGTLSNAQGRLDTARRGMEQLNLSIGRARRAADELRDAEARTGGEAGAVDKAREALRIADERKTAFEAKVTADNKAIAIVQNVAIQAALAPDGLRKKALARGLEAFNAALADLCKAAGWKAVALDADLMPRYGGRTYLLCSASEQYRVRATLAVAMARIDKSAMCIFDGADVLDGAGRNGLIKLLGAANMSALIAMTIGTPKQVPDLAALGLGKSYWLEQSIARPLNEEAARAA